MHEATSSAASDTFPYVQRALVLARPPRPAGIPPLREPGPRRADVAPPSDLERRRALHDALARGRARWPRVAIEREAFFRHCDRALGEARASAWVAHGVELYLCCACAAGDAAALRVLAAEYLSRLERQLLESNGDPELVQESLQALRIKLLVGPDPKIGRFAARGPLSHWLRASAKRTLLDVVRARKALRQADRDSAGEPGAHEPDLVAAIGCSRLASAFLDALRGAIERLDASDRRLLQHSVLDGRSIDVLGSVYSIHRSTASRRLRRIREQIARAVRRDLEAAHGLSDGDVDELARELGAWLEPRLRALLAGEPAPGGAGG